MLFLFISAQNFTPDLRVWLMKGKKTKQVAFKCDMTMKQKCGSKNPTTKHALRDGKLHGEDIGQTITYGGKNYQF